MPQQTHLALVVRDYDEALAFWGSSERHRRRQSVPASGVLPAVSDARAAASTAFRSALSCGRRVGNGDGFGSPRVCSRNAGQRYRAPRYESWSKVGNALLHTVG